MGLQRFNEDVATAARLSSAAVACAALADGGGKGDPFRGAAELDARAAVESLRRSWPSVKGLADSPDDPREWARCSQAEKTLRMAGLQHAVAHADADARAAPVFATLEADASGQAYQLRAAALSDMARLRSCAGALASAWLMAQPGLAELTAVEFRTNALIRLDDDLFPGQGQDMACVCGRAATVGGTHALVCGALWHTVVARHNMMVDAWRRLFPRAGISSSLEPHVRQLPQRLRAAGLPVLPSRPTSSHPRDGKTSCATLAASDLPTSPALAVPSAPYGTQASASAPPSAAAPPAGPVDVPPTARPLHLRCPTPTAPLPTRPMPPFSLTGSSLPAATPANAGAAAVTAVATASVGAAATQGNSAGTATAPSEPSMLAGPSGPPVPSAPAQPRGARGHAAAQQLPPRSRCDPERGDLLALLPGRPIVADICVTHPLASAVKAAARDTGATAKGKDSLKRDKYSRTGTGACRFDPLSHETFGRAGPAVFALLNEIAEFVAGSRIVSKKKFLKNAMRDLSTTLATVPLRARLNGRPVVAGLPVPTDDLVPVAGGPS